MKRLGARMALFWLLVAIPVAMAAPAPLATVPELDVSRYVGTWYQIAHFPNRFQARCVGETTADYSLLPDGRLRVRNRCRLADGTFDEALGVARRNAAYDQPGILQVRFAPAWLSFLPWVWGDYWILALEEDYSAVLIGTPSREYLWILARTPNLPEPVRQKLRALAAGAGFDVSRLVDR
jgi:apolipoprotein D and lipocalin family protein